MTITLPSLSAGSALAAYSAAAVNAAINQQKTNLENVLNGLQGFDAQLWNHSTATLASDTLSLTNMPRVLVIDTEAGAASDNLSTISNGTAYQPLFLRAANAGHVITIKHNVGNIKLNGGVDVILSASAWLLLFYDGSQYSDVFVPPSTSVPTQVCDTRLTLISGTPVTEGDASAATHVYVTPYKGCRMSLYNGTSWVIYTFSEIDINLSGFAANSNFDVFTYDNGSGTVIAETVVWTNDTTRATALALQDGVYVKSGTPTKRYIGTFRTAAIGQCWDTVQTRFVWNYYNRVPRRLYLIEATNSWTYATATFRPWNNSVINRFDFVRGVNEDPVQCTFSGHASQTGTVGATLAIGLDSASTPTGLISTHFLTSVGALSVPYADMPTAGYHYLQLLERAAGATVTFYGDNGAANVQSGAVGVIAA